MPKKAIPSTNPTQQTLFGYLGQQQTSPLRTKKPSTERSRKRKQPTSSTARQDQGSDEEEVENGNTSSDVDAIRFEPRKLIVISSDEEDEYLSPRKPKVKRVKPSGRATSSGAVSDDDELVVKPLPSSSKGKGIAQNSQMQGSSSEEELPKRRKLVKGKRPPTPDDDEDDALLEEVDEDAIVDVRLRSRNKKSAFQKNLDRLRRKKGKAVSASPEGSDGGSDGDISDEGSEQTTPFSGAKLDGSRAREVEDVDADEVQDDNDEDEDDFIVDDDASAAAVPALPFAFSMNSHQDLAHHFKIVCQLFVHLAVRPSEEREPVMKKIMKEEEYFSIPLQIARRKLSGVRDSLIASSVWRPEFKKALETYPEFSLTRLDFSVPQCDACHLGGRVSTLIGRLSGAPYNRLSFEPETDEASSEGDDSDGSMESKRRSSVRKEFHLGRFCAARTQAYHKFSHWEYSLFETLLAEVNGLRQPGGKRQFVRTGYAKGLLPPEDVSDADAIMDWLDDRGVVNFEWHRVRQMMDAATKLEAEGNSSKAENIDLDM